ncbi:hypothetical protein HDU97_009847 [Phlyctochytrium planicorne]|nr:hypothetical protein HDU97_009847 [Phlyctochytrium planicorne]
MLVHYARWEQAQDRQIHCTVAEKALNDRHARHACLTNRVGSRWDADAEDGEEAAETE